MQSGFAHVGTWKHVPVFFHWTVLLWFPLVMWSWTSGGLVQAFIAASGLVALLLAHEIGHAVAARSRGADVLAIRLFMFHGHCEHEHLGWEADQILIAWGGVLAQFCLLCAAAVAELLTAHLWPDGHAFFEPLFAVFIYINLVTAIINLVPVAPLDGHTAWQVLPLLGTYLRHRFQGATRAFHTGPKGRLSVTTPRKQVAPASLNSADHADGTGVRIISHGDASYECALVAWRELYRFYLGGMAVGVHPGHNLVDVASRIVVDRERRIRECMAAGQLSQITDDQALVWQKTNAELLAVIIEPYVLVQPA